MQARVANLFNAQGLDTVVQQRISPNNPSAGLGVHHSAPDVRPVVHGDVLSHARERELAGAKSGSMAGSGR